MPRLHGTTRTAALVIATVCAALLIAGCGSRAQAPDAAASTTSAATGAAPSTGTGTGSATASGTSAARSTTEIGRAHV